MNRQQHDTLFHVVYGVEGGIDPTLHLFRNCVPNLTSSGSAQKVEAGQVCPPCLKQLDKSRRPKVVVSSKLKGRKDYPIRRVAHS